jgi:hypothetical protein
MAIHTPHPDSHTHGLADDCPRCAEHAVDPVRGLDDENLLNLVARTRAWMDDDWENGSPRSDNELKAMKVIEQHLIFERHYERARAYLKAVV